MYGDKQKTTGSMQNLSEPFPKIVAEFKAKIDANEEVQIKSYYVDSLKQPMLDDMVKNFNRRVRFLITEIDLQHI